LMLLFRVPVYSPELCEMDLLKVTNLKKFERDDIEKHFEPVITGALDSFIYHRQIAPTRTVAEDIVIGAEQIDHLQISNGLFPVLFLVRSPCFLHFSFY